MDAANYTLIISCYDEAVIVRSGNSLSRLTTALYALLSPGISQGAGKIIDNYTGQVVRSSEQTIK